MSTNIKGDDKNSPLEGCLKGGVEYTNKNKRERSLFPYWLLPKNKNLIGKAKALRKQGVLSEVLFWKYFKDKRFTKGYDIDRQVIIGNYIVDFFIPELGFVIEIDGVSHDTRFEYDKIREGFLKSWKLEIIRFQDIDLKKNIEGISNNLCTSIKARIAFLTRNRGVLHSTPPFRHPSRGELMRKYNSVTPPTFASGRKYKAIDTFSREDIYDGKCD